jgi:ABC-type sugar transport system substrate-binding protein
MKRFFKSSLVLVVIGLMASVIYAAGIQYPISGIGPRVKTNVKAKKPYTIACIVKNSTNPYMVKQLDGFSKAAKAIGFKAITLSPAKQDSVEEQARIIEDLLQRGVDAIIVHPADSNGIVPAIEKAVAQGVPVGIIGTEANTDKYLFRTGVDYKETGFAIGEWIAKKLKGKGEIVILEGPPQAQNAHDRLDGIMDALKKYGKNIKVLASQTANFRRVEGMQVMENFLQRFKKIDAVIGMNDEEAMGAVMAIDAAGRGNEGIIVAGFDGNQDTSYAIKEGRMHVSFNGDPPSSAWCAAAYMVKYLNDGTKPPARFVPYPFPSSQTYVTQENVDDYLKNLAWWK